MLMQFVRQRAQPIIGRRDAGGEQQVVMQNRRAARTGDPQPGVRVVGEATLERIAGRDVGQQLAFDLLELDAPRRRRRRARAHRCAATGPCPAGRRRCAPAR